LATVIVAAVPTGLGGDGFLRGVSGAACRLRVPKVLVATTLAAFATSCPELTVSTMAALSGKPEIGLGDAPGSNVGNIALNFYLALLSGPNHAKATELGRYYALAIAVPVITLLLAFDGMLSLFDGGLQLLMLAGWMALVVRAGVANTIVLDVGGVPHSIGQIVAFGVGGLISLVVAGRLFVTGAPAVASTPMSSGQWLSPWGRRHLSWVGHTGQGKVTPISPPCRGTCPRSGRRTGG
jgi:cation:H+ antiporter